MTTVSSRSAAIGQFAGGAAQPRGIVHFCHTLVAAAARGLYDEREAHDLGRPVFAGQLAKHCVQ